jgi:hypothetical protein
VSEDNISSKSTGNCGTFHNPSEAQIIIDSLKNTNNLTRQEKSILNGIETRMPSKARSASHRDTTEVKSLHTADPQPLAPAATDTQKDVKDWERKDWEKYFQDPHDGLDLGFAGANFHLFTEKYGYMKARKVLWSLKVRGFTKQGRSVLRDLKINPAKQIVPTANKPINDTNTQSGSQPTNTDSHTTSVEASVQKTSSWNKEKWISYIQELKPKDGTETLITFVRFAQANLESASDLLENVKNRNLSAAQKEVLKSLRGKFPKPNTSLEKPKSEPVPAQTYGINTSQSLNSTNVVGSYTQASTTPKTQEEWSNYFRKLDKYYPYGQFLMDMESFKRFASQDIAGAARASVAIYEKVELKVSNQQVIEIKRALGVEEPEINLDNAAKPQKSNVTPTTNQEPNTKPELSTVLAEQQRILQASSEPLPSPNKVPNTEPKLDLDIEEEPTPVTIEKPKSAFDEKINNLVEDLLLALYRARTQVLDIKDKSPFKAAKLIAIKTMLKDSHPKLTQLADALETLQGKVLTDTDKYQLRKIANDFIRLRNYTDDTNIKESIKKFQTQIKALIGESLNRKSYRSLYDTSDLALEHGSPMQYTSEPEKDRKESFELIQELTGVLIQAVDKSSELTVVDKNNLRNWLTETFHELQELARDDIFFPNEYEFDDQEPEIDHQYRINILKFYAGILGLIQSKQAVSLASKDSNDEQALKSIIEASVNCINKYLLGKIDEIEWGEESQLKEQFKQAFSAPYKLS